MWITFSNIFYPKTRGCTMGGPLTITFGDIYMMKLENDIAAPLKSNFYKKYVDYIQKLSSHLN